ncbi:MAG: tetratricopeptide repeat protein, partial [Stellaceae bacterium]
AYHLVQVLKPNDPEAAFRMGELMLVRGSPQAAIDEFNIALETRKDDPALFSAMGVAHSSMGQYDVAIKTYQAGLAIVPEHKGLLNNLAMAQFLSGDYDGAVKTLTALVALPNAEPRYRRNLAFIEAVHGDMDKAQQVVTSDADRAALNSELAAYRNAAADQGDAADRTALMGIHFATLPARPASQAAADKTPDAVAAQ